MTPTSYTRAVADEICRRMSDGERLRAICRGIGMASEGTVPAGAPGSGWLRIALQRLQAQFEPKET